MAAQKNYNYTVFLKKIFEDRFSGLKSYYCREDYEKALAGYDAASKDARKFRRKDLVPLCEGRGIDADRLIRDRSLLQEIPTRKEMQDQLLDGFHDLYSGYKTSSDYMERIVRRLAPEYADCSVRLAILKKFLSGAGPHFRRFDTDGILNIVRSSLCAGEKEQVLTMAEEDQRQFLISRVDEAIFDQSVQLEPEDILRLIGEQIRKFQKDGKSGFQGVRLTENTKACLDAFLKENGIEGTDLTDTEKVLAAADAQKDGKISSKDPEQGKKLADLLKADFRNQLNGILYVNGKGKEDKLSTVFKQTLKDALKSKKKKLQKLHTAADQELLDLCSDLAFGRFRGNGKTKQYLYYFAFMFGMSWEPEKEKERLRRKEEEGLLTGEEQEQITGMKEKDLVFNLFEDYYNDNLLRYLSADFDDPKIKSSLEGEPTGEGINYKNFCEAIYLWYLNHDLGLCPGRMIDRAEEKIDECVKVSRGIAGKADLMEADAAKADTAKEDAPPSGLPGASSAGAARTVDFRDARLPMLLEKDEKDITGYILKNYQMPCADGPAVPRILTASEEITAGESISLLIDELDQAYADEGVFGALDTRELGNSEADRRKKKEIQDDIAESADITYDWQFLKLLRARFQSDSQFMKLLDKLDEKLNADTGRLNQTDRDRLLILLHVLGRNSIAAKEKEPAALPAGVIADRMRSLGASVEDLQLQKAIQTLRTLGYNIETEMKDIKHRRETDGEKTRRGRESYSSYYLAGQSSPEDPELSGLLKAVSIPYFRITGESREMITQLILKRMAAGRKATRYEMIATHFRLYTALLEDTEGFNGTFPDVLEDYRDTVDELLLEARYQPISEKNIFDLFVVLSLYFYLTEER